MSDMEADELMQQPVPKYLLRLSALHHKGLMTTMQTAMLTNMGNKKFVSTHRQGAKTIPIIDNHQRYLQCRLGEQDYVHVASVLNYSQHRSVQRNREHSNLKFHIGNNDHVLEVEANSRFGCEWTVSMGDATRNEMHAERLGSGIVGHCMSPDPDNWSRVHELWLSETANDLVECIQILRSNDLLAHQIHTEALCCLTKFDRPFLVYYLIAEPRKGMSGTMHLRWWMKFMSSYQAHGVMCVGWCTDSCSTGLSAAYILMTPSANMLDLGVTYLGLDADDYEYFSAYLRPAYISIKDAQALEKGALAMLREVQDQLDQVLHNDEGSIGFGNGTASVKGEQDFPNQVGSVPDEVDLADTPASTLEQRLRDAKAKVEAAQQRVTESQFYDRCAHGVPPALSWFPDCAHIARSIKRNLRKADLHWLFQSEGEDAICHGRFASFSQIDIKLAHCRSFQRHGMKAMVTINSFMSQGSDDALALLKQSTLTLLEKELPNDKATLAVLRGANRIIEVWRNPHFTNPFLAVRMLWKGFHTFVIQRNYVREVVQGGKLRRKCDYLPSPQLFTSLSFLAHVATNYFLNFHRSYRGGRDKWRHASLSEAKNDRLEGQVHGSMRHRGNNVNFTQKEFAEGVSSLQQEADAKAFLQSLPDPPNFSSGNGSSYTYNAAFQTLGLEPGISEIELSHWSAKIPDDPDDFHKLLLECREQGIKESREEYERDHPIAVQQFRIAGKWECRDEDGVKRRWRKKNSLPANMRVAKGPTSMLTLPRRLVTPSDIKLTKKIIKASDKLDASVLLEKAQAEKAEPQADCDNDEDASNGNANASQLQRDMCRLADLQAKAKEHTLRLRAEHEAASTVVRMEAIKHDGEVEVNLSKLHAGIMVKASDSEAYYVNVDQLVNKQFRREKAHVARWMRFWVSRLKEFQPALREGHDTTYGTCLLIKWSTKNRFALVRVLMLVEKGQKVHSFRLQKKNSHQLLRVELLQPKKSAVSKQGDSHWYESSGVEFSALSTCMVLEAVQLTPMLHVRGQEPVSDALLPMDKILKLREPPFKMRQITSSDGLVHLQEEEQEDKIKNFGHCRRVEGWDHRACDCCQSSWFDAKKGLIVKCAKCHRRYHQQCTTPTIKSEEMCGWQCPVCAGLDKTLCAKCKEPYSVFALAEDSDEEDNNVMVMCDGECGRWFHQDCHAPPIRPLPSVKWLCCDCGDNGMQPPPVVIAG